MDIIGQQIRKYRNKKGYTQEALGKVIGVTTQAVSKWERGGTPDAEVLPLIADALGVDIDALYGREERDIQLLMIKKLSKLPQDEAFRYAFNICWSILLGLTGDADYTEDFSDTFMRHPDINREKSTDYFAKMIRNDGIALARLSAGFSQFYLVAEPQSEDARSRFEDIEAIRRVFALFAEENLLKTLCYLYSMPVMPLTAALVESGTGLEMREVERCMQVICDLHLATRMKIATVNGVIDSYAIRREGCAVPLLSFADEIAKGSPHPIFSMFDREKPLI